MTATVNREPPRQTIFGIFANDRRAADALRDLAAAGFDADRIRLIAGDPAPGRITGGLSAIGRTLGGYASGGRVSKARTSGPVVAVQCAADDCEFAAQLLDGAGAREVREAAEPS